MNRFSLVLAALLLSAPVLASADAYRPGSGFQVGGVYFHVVSVSTEGDALFRVGERLPEEGEEHAACYRVGSAFYHHEACPVVQSHFARSGAPADSDAPIPAAAGQYAAGSHPIDYLRGSYVEPRRPFSWGYAAPLYGPWFGTTSRVGFQGRHSFGFRGHHGRFHRGFHGRRAVGGSFRRW